LVRYGLSPKERIKSKKDFEKIFSIGKHVFSKDKRIKAFYITEANPQLEYGVKMGVAIKKRAGKAVWRNRLKRLVRESFRLNKTALVENCTRKEILLKIVFAAGTLNQKEHKKIKLQEIMPGVEDIMLKIGNNI